MDDPHDFLALNDLLVANTAGHPPTYMGAHGIAWIDATFYRGDIKFTEWTVELGKTSSDHNMLNFGIDTLGVEYEPPPKRYNEQKAKWNLFLASLYQSLAHVMPDPDVDRTAESIMKMIIDTCETSIPQNKDKVKADPP